VRTKEELRSELLARRRALSADDVAAASRAIAERALAEIGWRTVRALHVYAPVAAWGEVDTTPLVSAVQAQWPGVAIARPGQDKDQPIPSEPFDVIAVPVVGFDRDNNRLGLGGGWYDRFLAGQPDARKVGLAYAWALVPEGLPVEPHDVPLDCVVTDEPV
jgi:5-formyltetrahydrofolate cyclo-ligase